MIMNNKSFQLKEVESVLVGGVKTDLFEYNLIINMKSEWTEFNLSVSGAWIIL